MTNEEAIKILKEAIAECCIDSCGYEHSELPECDFCNTYEAYSMAIKALEKVEKVEKYRWHDLRKDPNDLPETCDEVLVVTSSGWFCGTMATAYYNPIKRSNFVVNTEGVRIGEDENRAGYKPWDDVIAWKYIEQFGGES